MKTKLITIISVLVVIAGIAILAYPIISNRSLSTFMTVR